jgi:hypothetical protein
MSILDSIIRKIPVQARMAVGFGTLTLLVLIIYVYLLPGSGNLTVVCRENFRSAELSVYVDGSLAFSDQISGNAKKRFGILDERIEGTLSKVLSLPLGDHVVRAHLTSVADRFDQTKQVEVNLVSGKESTVSITAPRGELSLAYQGPSLGAVKDSGMLPSGPLRSMLVTVAGSVVSAAIGFGVQEFLKTRKEAATTDQNSG